ncbi:PAS domain S-box protein [Algibacter sp. L4_22]|uniref:PAS domain S-box protein n=1 Tax=Algibacter sp. L4_22 TaxID=2942477 RepID=UPI00201B472F|nr:PAS domain S-box protein [Algibacter sp. L4_22]MCL5129147.1 PAS domain S-box protein [Algibacter sp. L4_22]
MVDELKDRELFRGIFESSVEGILVVNNHGYIIKANPSVEKMFGYAPGELVKRKVEGLIPDKFIQAYKALIVKDTTETTSRFLGEGKDIYGLKKDGTQILLEISLSHTEINGSELVTAFIRDITEEKAIENILYIRNQILASTARGIIICDAQQPNYPIVYGNDSFSKITGYKNSDFMGKNCRFLIGEDREQNDIKIILAAIKKGKECHVVLRNYRKDGSLFWNEVSISPIFNNKKELTHYVGVQNDVTEQKMEDFFKIGQSHVMDMIIQHEPLKNITNRIIEIIETAIPNCIGSILLLNKETKTLQKLTVTNLPKGFTNAIEGLPIGVEKEFCSTAAYFKKEVIVTDIFTDPFWENHRELALAANLKACWSFPIFSSNQELLGTFAIYFNTPRKPLAAEREIILNMAQVTSVAIEQYNTSEALHQSKEELAAYAGVLENRVSERTFELKDIVQKLVESNLSLEDQIQFTKLAENRAIASHELLGNISRNFPRGFVAVVNLQVEVVFIEGEELDELGFRSLAATKVAIRDVKGILEEVKHDIIENIQKTFKGQHCSFEVDIQDRSYLINTTPLFDKDKNIVQVLLVHNNISDQKNIEIEIRNTLEKEKELNELRSRFISMASHEFRTPLSVILSATNLIERQNITAKGDKLIKYVDKIKASVNNLVYILNDLLSLSKLEEGKEIAQPTLFDFIDFSKSLVEEIEGIKKQGQIIDFKSYSTYLEVNLDPKLVRHFLHNLLLNAIKYSEENKVIKFEIQGDKDRLIIVVADQGIGIPIEDQHSLFQRFFRASNATTYQGTGLGLNIVRQYIELMGGNISFVSALNKGTTFTVELPLNLIKNEKNTTN